MGRGDDRIICPYDIQNRNADIAQMVEETGRRHEPDTGRDILRPGLLKLQTHILQGGHGAIILPWAALVEDAFDRSPAELFAGRYPAQEKLPEKEGSDSWHPEQFCRQALLTLETTTGEGAE